MRNAARHNWTQADLRLILMCNTKSANWSPCVCQRPQEQPDEMQFFFQQMTGVQMMPSNRPRPKYAKNACPNCCSARGRLPSLRAWSTGGVRTGVDTRRARGAANRSKRARAARRCAFLLILRTALSVACMHRYCDTIQPFSLLSAADRAKHQIEAPASMSVDEDTGAVYLVDSSRNQLYKIAFPRDLPTARGRAVTRTECG